MMSTSSRPPLASRPTVVDDDASIDGSVSAKGKHADDDDSDVENNTNNARHRPPRPSMRGIRQSLAATASQRRRRRRSSARFLRLHNHHQHAEDSSNGDDDSSNSSSTDRNLQELYQKAIRLHAENKINASNSWNLHLIENIDNFLIENNDQQNEGGAASDDDEEKQAEAATTAPDSNIPPRQKVVSRVNFTKASCTLDASVKIYSYRVDDVHLTSYKVLANLNRSDQQKQQRKESQQGSDDGADDPERGRRSRSRAAATSGSTIESHMGKFSII